MLTLYWLSTRLIKHKIMVLTHHHGVKLGYIILIGCCCPYENIRLLTSSLAQKKINSVFERYVPKFYGTEAFLGQSLINQHSLSDLIFDEPPDFTSLVVTTSKVCIHYLLCSTLILPSIA